MSCFSNKRSRLLAAARPDPIRADHPMPTSSEAHASFASNPASVIDELFEREQQDRYMGTSNGIVSKILHNDFLFFPFPFVEK
jgi:hypothetical protein